ncbi:MAG: Crp/Fnr family transcriptional regulator [Clostridia bacterium]|nr:Crp/Fnr family transcriptional regulator [Clostridia bacterium]
MASVKFTKDQTIYRTGERSSIINIIAEGSVQVKTPFITMTLQKNDILGMFDSQSIYYPFEYTVLEDVTIYQYPYTSISDLAALINNNPTAAGILTSHFAEECATLLDVYSSLYQDCATLYHEANDYYDKYQMFCESYEIEAATLPGIKQLSEYSQDTILEDWLSPYYTDLSDINSANWKTFYSSHPNACAGFIYTASADFMKVLPKCERLYQYIDMLCDLYISDFNLDLYSFYLKLYESLIPNSEWTDLSPIKSTMDTLVRKISKETYFDKTIVNERLKEYQALSSIDASADQSTHQSTSLALKTDIMSELENSIDTILIYAEFDDAASNKFRSLIKQYRELPDRASTDDTTKAIRKDLTNYFYDLYQKAFFKSLTDEAVPVILKMFFYFGYVDEKLIGINHAVELFTMTENIAPDEKHNVFLLYDWLMQIYQGKKEPCINELNVDYTTYLRNLRLSNKITPQQEESAQRNAKMRLQFEFDNMFKLTNKLTQGHISTFCPILSDHNLYKQLRDAYVTAENIHQALDTIRSIDYSAYYRETIFSAPEEGIIKELLQTEVLPDIILMPNIGTRSIMWQEITGKKRTSPARMMLSVLSLEDLYPSMVRLTGEFRWELCRRIQGVRWNDISERSLTSDYCEYIQTYKKNRDLSTDAKDKLKQNLIKARNHSKELFVRDYIDYVMFESNGSIRLNKLARNMLFQYCPFSKEIRLALEANPLYHDIIERYHNKNRANIRTYENMLVRLENNKIKIPEEIKLFRNYLNF